MFLYWRHFVKKKEKEQKQICLVFQNVSETKEDQLSESPDLFRSLDQVLNQEAPEPPEPSILIKNLLLSAVSVSQSQ